MSGGAGETSLSCETTVTMLIDYSISTVSKEKLNTLDGQNYINLLYQVAIRLSLTV